VAVGVWRDQRAEGRVNADVIRSFSFRCDSQAHRVVVTDADGRVVLEFGGFGRQPGAFDTPIDATLVMPEFFGEPPFGHDDVRNGSVTPWLAVADYGNHRVQIFELDGTLVGVIDEDILGDAAGRPCRPCGLVWRDPVLEIEGVDGGKTRLHLGAALLHSEAETMLPSASPSMFVAKAPRSYRELN
jgi:hypothetical protein